MKTIISIAIMMLCWTIQAPSYAAFYPHQTQVMQGHARVNVGLNYDNPVRTLPQAQPVNRVIINTGNNEFVTPPPPPPPRHKYRYRDFAGDKRYPNRSYYVPSYCMPGTVFYQDAFNPFCNHYRPYGSNMYMSY
jgi:hypothetical protein